MRLLPLTKDDCYLVWHWRKNCPEALRTTFPLTGEMQHGFYDNVICDKTSVHRYWSINDGDKFAGMGGLTDIQWENSIAEISLIMNPEWRDGQSSEKAVQLLLRHGFNNMGLKTIFGECYNCNCAGIGFWQRVCKHYGSYQATLPNRKYWNGKYWDSFYFSIDAKDFNKTNPPIQQP